MTAAAVPPPDDMPPIVGGVTAEALHLYAQDITHCGDPMRYITSHTTWTGRPEHGTETTTSRRICLACGAELTYSTTRPA